MIVYYENGYDRIDSVDLTIDISESLRLAEEMLGNGSVTVCETFGIDPAPYDGLLERVIVEITSGLVKIQVNARDLIFSGGLEAMSVLGQNFEYFGNVPLDERQVKGYHMHIEYYPQHFFLSPDAVPMVVSSRESRLLS